MDDSQDSVFDKRLTRTIFNVPEDLNNSESVDYIDESLHSICEPNEGDKQEDATISKSENNSCCEQLRNMTPNKISQLLGELELNDVQLTRDEIQEDNQMEDNYQEIPKQKKGKATKVIKNESKKAKDKKANELEQYDKEEPISIKVEASKKEIAKSEKPKRGQKEAADIDVLNNKCSNKAVANSKSTDLVPSEVPNGKKPNRSKGKKANELKDDDKEECLSTAIVGPAEENTKTVKHKRGQKETVDVEHSNNKDSNEATVHSKSTDSVPPDVIIEKKSNKSKVKKVSELEHDDKERHPSANVGAFKEETTKTNKPTRVQKKAAAAADVDNLNSKDTHKQSNKPIVISKSIASALHETIIDKKPNKSKKNDNGKGNEAILKEKSSKPGNKTANETDGIKESNLTKPELLGADEKKCISTRTRSNKSPSKTKSDQEVIKPNNKKETILEKETVEITKKKVNGGKQKTTENKENKAKNTKAKTEPTKKEKLVDKKENTVVAETVVKKRVTRKK